LLFVPPSDDVLLINGVCEAILSETARGRGGGGTNNDTPSFGRRLGMGGAARDGVDGIVETGRGGGVAAGGLLGKLGGSGTFLDGESDRRAGIGGAVGVLIGTPPTAGGARRGNAGGAAAGVREDEESACAGGALRLGSDGGPGEGAMGMVRLGIGGGARVGDEVGIGGGKTLLGVAGGGSLDCTAATSTGAGLGLLDTDARGGTDRLGGVDEGGGSLFGIVGSFAKGVEVLA
jgi:hypothetical protein